MLAYFDDDTNKAIIFRGDDNFNAASEKPLRYADVPLFKEAHFSAAKLNTDFHISRE